MGACVRARPRKSACVCSANGGCFDDALLCFSVAQAGHWTTGRWTTGHREQGRNELGGQAKDLQPQKVTVLGFALELLVN